MKDMQYSSSEVAIKDKDEERTEKVLKAIKEQGYDNTAHIINSRDSITSTLKMIYWILIFSIIVNMFTAGLLIYILYRLFG
jgi:cytochrome b subunit of formate dehydrogenase